MNLLSLTIQAINYLTSLKSPLPCDQTEEGKAWYIQNEKDYQALLTLNKMGLGTSFEDLEELKSKLEHVVECYSKEQYHLCLQLYTMIEDNVRSESIEQFHQYWVEMFDKKTTNTQIKTAIKDTHSIKDMWEQFEENGDCNSEDFRWEAIESLSEHKKKVTYREAIKLIKKEEKLNKKFSKYLVTANTQQKDQFFDEGVTCPELFYS